MAAIITSSKPLSLGLRLCCVRLFNPSSADRFSPTQFRRRILHCAMWAQQDADNVVWDRSDEVHADAIIQVRSGTWCRQVESFAARIFDKPATMVFPMSIGGFNVLYPVHFEDSYTEVLIRLPLPDQTRFHKERLLADAATTAYFARHTRVPVPKVHHRGIDPNTGPFMIIEDLKSRRTMSHVLAAPREDLDESPILCPDISVEKLKSAYFGIVQCVLQIAQPQFPRIEALVDVRLGSCGIFGRPITINMSNMVQLSNIPESVLPPEGVTYQTADEWYVALANMQMATLIFQHNDMVMSEDDCRCKYVARQLVRRLANQGRLSKFGFAEDDWSAYSMSGKPTLQMPNGSGSFRIWNDHFRPSEILVDDSDKVLGVIDWEFAYAAPTQFVLDSPWWLLLEKPEMWRHGIENWACIYERRLETWLSALEAAEMGMSPDSVRLSTYMRESWRTGRFWLNYAAKESWAFDNIYWTYLDELFFGARNKDTPAEQLWRTRIHLLDDEERAAMEPLVQIKLAESKERIVVDWEPEAAKRRMSSFLFN